MIITKNERAASSIVLAKAKRYGLVDAALECTSLKQVLAGIPVTTKARLYDFGYRNRELFIRKGILFSETSGTTGKPLLTPRCEEDLKWNINNQMLAYKRHIQPSADRVAIIHPGILSPFVEASAMALNVLGVGLIRLYPVPKVCDYARMLSSLEKNDITTIMTTPSLAYKLLYEISRLDPKFERLPVYKFLLTGEYLSKANAENIKKLVGEHAYVVPFVYGSSEAATLMYGVEDCSYRTIKEDFVFELVDPKTGDWVELRNGQTSVEGKLLVTWLRDGLLPIVRYDTNDYFSVQIADGEDCWEIIGRDTGASAGKILDKRAVDRVIYESDIPVFHFTCSVTGEGIGVSIISNFGFDDVAALERLTKDLEKSTNGGGDIKVTVNPEQHDFYHFSLSPKMNRFYFS